MGKNWWSIFCSFCARLVGKDISGICEVKMSEDTRQDFSLPESLLWLMDASLFIDEELVNKYYDAIVRPVHTEGPRTIRIGENNVDKISGKLGISGKVAPSELMSKLVSFLNFEVQASADVAGATTSAQSREETIELQPIKTPHRRLEQLALHYVVNETDRIFLEDDTKRTEWQESEHILKTPRALAFFNFPSQDEAKQHNLPETRIIPVAAEFENGEVVPIYQDLKFGRWVPPEYPQAKTTDYDLDQLRQERKNYWAEFAESYNATDAMLALEKAAKGRGRIRWIAFRVPLIDEGDSLHLHIHAAEKYDTGTFAYNFIKRGHKHGFRVIGMLKSEPDLNVLAIYEK